MQNGGPRLSLTLLESGNGDADALADLRLKTIGSVFRDFHLFPKLTAAENVAIPRMLS